ncbi:MAG: hypothetical protein EP330_02930 [Deltaproteobacteria bacterium]|nr:MAG: hypothetical protein EP330_02930 [Deltaproteobacteria bacterium]
MSRKRALAKAAVVAGLGLVGLLTAGRLAFFFPADEMDAPIQCTGDTRALASGDTLRILIWNVQYSGGRKRHFFYDGGPDVHVPPAEREAALEGIARVIKDVDADIVLLQEVDRGSDRTQRSDQLAEILERVPYPCSTAAPYHRAPYVPHPPEQNLGRVDMNLAVLSKHKLTRATRYQLPLLDEPFHRRLFNLRRALLEVAVPLGSGELRLFNTHLSAFSRGDGTLGKQVAMLAKHMRQATEAKVPWVLGGDLNSLPPGDDPSRLGEHAGLYADATTPVQALYDAFTPAMSAETYHAEPEKWRTYVSFGEDQADRVLDYAFHGGVEQLDYEVLQVLDVSDHLPIVLTIRVP